MTIQKKHCRELRKVSQYINNTLTKIRKRHSTWTFTRVCISLWVWPEWYYSFSFFCIPLVNGSNVLSWWLKPLDWFLPSLVTTIHRNGSRSSIVYFTFDNNNQLYLNEKGPNMLIILHSRISSGIIIRLLKQTLATGCGMRIFFNGIPNL